jgi:hypothetical protein
MTTPRKKPQPVIDVAPAAAGGQHTDGPVIVKLAGKDVTVLPVERWRSSGMRAFKEGNYDAWAEKCLASGSYAVWQSVDPTVADLTPFFEAWSAAPGETR